MPTPMTSPRPRRSRLDPIPPNEPLDHETRHTWNPGPQETHAYHTRIPPFGRHAPRMFLKTTRADTRPELASRHATCISTPFISFPSFPLSFMYNIHSLAFSSIYDSTRLLARLLTRLSCYIFLTLSFPRLSYIKPVL